MENFMANGDKTKREWECDFRLLKLSSKFNVIKWRWGVYDARSSTTYMSKGNQHSVFTGAFNVLSFETILRETKAHVQRWLDNFYGSEFLDNIEHYYVLLGLDDEDALKMYYEINGTFRDVV